MTVFTILYDFYLLFANYHFGFAADSGDLSRLKSLFVCIQSVQWASLFCMHRLGRPNINGSSWDPFCAVNVKTGINGQCLLK